MKRVQIAAFALIGFFLFGFGNEAIAQAQNVVIYNDYNFQGANMALTGNWNAGGGFDRNIKSIRVPAGYRVRMFTEKNFKGTETLITEDWNPGRGAYWINKVRSIRLESSGQPGPGSNPTAKGDDILAGEQLNVNQSITSKNSRYTLIYQSDGNLVLYSNSNHSPLWSSNTAPGSAGSVNMQSDGNFVVHDASGNPLWSSTTTNTGGNRLVVQDDGNMVIYRADNVPVWSTNTTQSVSVESFPVLYAGTNFDGPAEAIERDKAQLVDWDGSPHTIRSIRVPQGWYLVAYTKKNFGGKPYNLNTNITFAPGDELYNKIRSIKVSQGRPPIQPR
jgi:hypothetical protein